jgi:RNA polymerase sigma-70 factor (ECF subfamily)
MNSDERQLTRELTQRALDNDENACQRLLNMYKARVFSYVYRMVQNYHDAEDITFDSFIKCFKSLKRYDPSKKFTTWLFTIAHNTTIDFLRKHKQVYEYLDDRHSVKDDFVRKYEEKKKQERIDKAIALLAPLDRELVILFHREEHSYQEISEILKLPVTTVKTRLHRARKRLRTLVHEKK